MERFSRTDCPPALPFFYMRRWRYFLISSSDMKPSVTDKGKDVIIAAKNKRIRELEAEVDRLSSILKSFYAKEYEKY